MIAFYCKEAKEMDKYVTGAVIRKLRERKKMTQEELAEKVYVSSKAVSKWETGQGFPDISLLEPLAKALDISVIELLSGEDIRNLNRSSNMAKGKFYVCPVCGNAARTTGEAVVSCCGITLPPLEPEPVDDDHAIRVKIVEDEYYVTISHPMTKDHYISFLAAVSDQGVQLEKLYPEGNAEARFKISRVKMLYAYCNRHGLFQLQTNILFPRFDISSRHSNDPDRRSL
jgi:desulfoferrodoxin (superoxide reductase-like protein)/DNA-binding XRE family transcriptional regulator